MAHLIKGSGTPSPDMAQPGHNCGNHVSGALEGLLVPLDLLSVYVSMGVNMGFTKPTQTIIGNLKILHSTPILLHILLSFYLEISGAVPSPGIHLSGKFNLLGQFVH